MEGVDTGSTVWMLLGKHYKRGEWGGKIFVYDVADLMRIRTSTRGSRAVSDEKRDSF